uniref:Uncharacterized protein n=1 Tax=Pipistrellus kuhlii TaxID=59472 RepID=A0A7J7TW38_PIPKU|nr:hypothetical protein mPipKuh1_010855 [Pipistrellus kuhlii]
MLAITGGWGGNVGHVTGQTQRDWPQSIDESQLEYKTSGAPVLFTQPASPSPHSPSSFGVSFHLREDVSEKAAHPSAPRVLREILRRRRRRWRLRRRRRRLL